MNTKLKLTPDEWARKIADSLDYALSWAGPTRFEWLAIAEKDLERAELDHADRERLSSRTRIIATALRNGA